MPGLSTRDVWKSGPVEVVFEKTGARRYAVAVHRSGLPALRMDPAPGFDRHFPHDMQHLIVEEQLDIVDGIFGRLANGGTASTFRPDDPDGLVDNRARSRYRRRLRQRNDRLSAAGSPDFGKSERATFIVWHDWLAHCHEEELRAAAGEMAATARTILDGMSCAERTRLTCALPRIRERVDVVARQWVSLSPGDSMCIPWTPLNVRGCRGPRH